MALYKSAYYYYYYYYKPDLMYFTGNRWLRIAEALVALFLVIGD